MFAVSICFLVGENHGKPETEAKNDLHVKWKTYSRVNTIFIYLTL